VRDFVADLIDLWFFQHRMRGQELYACIAGAWAAYYPSMTEGPMGGMVFPWSPKTTEAEWEWLREWMPRRYAEWIAKPEEARQ